MPDSSLLGTRLLFGLAVRLQSFLSGEDGWRTEVTSDQHFASVTVRITGCMFIDFFGRHKHAELVPVFCRLHRQWEPICQSGAIRFTWESWLAMGHSSCTFRFDALERASDPKTKAEPATA